MTVDVPFVAIYALTGSAIWQLVFRPLEENDLEIRFGREYQRYRNSVKCWLPRSAPYQMDGISDSSISTERPSGIQRMSVLPSIAREASPS